MIITSPAKFADWFNDKYPGAYRQISTQDVKDMTDCGLIHLYEYYSRSIDGELIRRILLYERMREDRSQQQEKHSDLPKCKMCGEPLPAVQESKPGRPKEYCSDCELFRNRERQKKLRYRHRGNNSKKLPITVRCG